MIRMARFIIVACILGALIAIWPIVMESIAQFPPQQETAIDAVQSEQIRALDRRVTRNATVIDATNDKLNWIEGGIAGIYGLMAVIGAFNLRIIGGKKP